MTFVALLTESVDRNIYESEVKQNDFVALLTESVDRNRICTLTNLSPSSRSPHGERG